jgi:signal transduction histidine kinase
MIRVGQGRARRRQAAAAGALAARGRLRMRLTPRQVRAPAAMALALGAGLVVLSIVFRLLALQAVGAALLAAGGAVAWWTSPPDRASRSQWLPRSLAVIYAVAVVVMIVDAIANMPREAPAGGPIWSGSPLDQASRGAFMVVAAILTCSTLPPAIRGRPLDEWVSDVLLLGLGVTVPVLTVFVAARSQLAPLNLAETIVILGIMALAFAGSSMVLWPRPPFADPGQALVVVTGIFGALFVQLIGLAGGGWGPLRHPIGIIGGVYLGTVLVGAGGLVRTPRPRFESLRLMLSVSFGLAAASSPWIAREPKPWVAFPIAFGVAAVLAFRLIRTSHRLEEMAAREQRAAAELRAVDEMKTTFLRAVSHDLRTPLTVILGVALTLERSEHLLSPEERLELVRRLGTNARKLDRLLADLLDLERLSRGIVEPNRRPTDVGALVRQLASGMDALASQPLTVEAPSVVVWVDAPKVERIVENLLINVVKHTPPGTPVWVKVVGQHEGVLIAVEDAGPGLSPEQRGVVFDVFQRGATAAPHAPGVGIGLSLVSSFAELHGGRAWVEDRPGGGCSFKVLLPGGCAVGPGAADGPGGAGRLASANGKSEEHAEQREG